MSEPPIKSIEIIWNPNYGPWAAIFWPKTLISALFGPQVLASLQKSVTCVFEGSKSEKANTSSLSGLRRSVFMLFLIFLASHPMQHSMLFLAFSVLDAIKPSNSLRVVLVSDFPCPRAKIFTFFSSLFNVSSTVLCFLNPWPSTKIRVSAPICNKKQTCFSDNFRFRACLQQKKC